MTRLILEVPNQHDLDLLLPLLRRLQIRVARTETDTKPATDVEEALRIIRQGCDMSALGDALQYQLETRQDRTLPFRD